MKISAVGWLLLASVFAFGQAQNFPGASLGSTNTFTATQTFSGSPGVIVPVGSASATSVQRSGSAANSGIWFPLDGWMNLVTAGLNKATVGNAQMDLPSNGTFCIVGTLDSWTGSCDTFLARGSANVFNIGATNGATTGFVKTAQTLQVITSNYTTTATTLATAGVVTGLNFTAPASAATNWSFRCDLIYSQATAAAADLFGITTAGTAPTNLQVGAEVYTNNTGTQVDNNALITTATSTTVVMATPSAAGAIGTNADMFNIHIFGTVEAPSNASPTQVGIAVATGAGADALTIYRGSSCWFY